MDRTKLRYTTRFEPGAAADQKAAQRARVEFGVATRALDAEMFVVVTFFDSRAAHAVVRSSQGLHASGTRLEIVSGNRFVNRVLEITAVDQIFQIHPTLARAIGQTPSTHSSLEPRPAMSSAAPIAFHA